MMLPGIQGFIYWHLPLEIQAAIEGNEVGINRLFVFMDIQAHNILFNFVLFFE
jgi:hypothetical protein